MYNRAFNVCLIACSEAVNDVFQLVQAPKGFTSEIAVRPALADAPLDRADILVLGSGLSPADIRLAWLAKKPAAELLLLREETAPLFDEWFAMIRDIWRVPMPADELKFRVSRFYENFRQTLDLWETKQFLDIALDASPNLIWFKTKNGVHEKVNASFCRVVGKTRDDVEGKTHAYIWNVERDDPACELSERKVMESGKIHASEEVIETGEGKRILTTYKAPLRDRDGAMMGTIGIGVDVTRERRYRKQLLDHNATLENIFMNMDCGVLCHSLDGRHLISVNKAALKLLGYESGEEMESAGFDVCAPSVVEEDKAKIRDVVRALKKVGDTVNYEYRIERADGDVSHVMGTAKLTVKDGQLTCQRFLLDCTAQKLAEERERREKDLWQKELVRALCEDFQLVCVLDADTGKGQVLRLVEDSDPALKEIFSGSETPAISLGEYIQKRAHPDDREEFVAAADLAFLKEKLRERQSTYFNYRALAEPEFLYYQFKAVRADTPDGSFRVVFGLQSVDERERHEQEQKNKLAEALKQAKQASAAKSLFLSNMSHDIRTPMNAVVGYAGLALSRLDERERAEDYLNKILSSGNHLISLINDILDMSYIESGKLRLEEKPCSLPRLLDALRHIMEQPVDEKNQTLRIEWDLRDEIVWCDRLRLNQILLNLIGNAVKYTPAGGEIGAAVRQLPSEDPERGLYEFRVKDNGPGMSKEFLTRIFEPFERERTSTVAGVQGTGLGMAITRNIADKMGGELSVSSEAGKGTEFVFRVTFRLASEMESSPENDGHATNVIPERKRSGKILLVDDNEMNQEIAEEFLTEAGYTVKVVSDGQEAVNEISGSVPGHYDIILMDLQMPVMDGYEAAEFIRSLPDDALANIPIIAMSANSFEEDKREAMARGMNGHVAKPVDFKTLFDTLDKFLKIPAA